MLKRLNELINEAWDTSVKTGSSTEASVVDVFKNPTSADVQELRKIRRENNAHLTNPRDAFRFVIETTNSDVYLFDGLYTTHWPMLMSYEKKLKVPLSGGIETDIRQIFFDGNTNRNLRKVISEKKWEDFCVNNFMKTNLPRLLNVHEITKVDNAGGFVTVSYA